MHLYLKYWLKNEKEMFHFLSHENPTFNPEISKIIIQNVVTDLTRLCCPMEAVQSKFILI